MTAADRQEFIEYEFPLADGSVATLYLPKRLEGEDAERLAAYIKALVLDA